MNKFLLILLLICTLLSCKKSADVNENNPIVPPIPPEVVIKKVTLSSSASSLINYNIIKDSIESAKKWFADIANKNKELVLLFPAGEFKVEAPATATTAIAVNDFDPGPGNKLIFRGAGSDWKNGGPLTTFIFPRLKQVGYGAINAGHIKFTNIHFSRGYTTVTQGQVALFRKGVVFLKIPAGFPSPVDLDDPNLPRGIGKWLKKYTMRPGDLYPHLDTAGTKDDQVGYESSEDTLHQTLGKLCKMVLLNPFAQPFAVGDTLGVKSKNSAPIYEFMNCSNLEFDSLTWSGQSRGLIQGTFQHVRITNCRVYRMLPLNGITEYCMSTPSGGPQIGNEFGTDITAKHIVVENCRFEALGDDNIALFKVDSTRLSKNYCGYSFVHGIFVNSSRVICADISENNHEWSYYNYVRFLPTMPGTDVASNCSYREP